MGKIVDALQAIEAFAQKQGLSLKLKPAAEEAEISKLEEALGQPLPADYRELLLFADGQDDEASFPWMPGCPRLASVKAVTSQLGEERSLADEYPPPDEEENEGRVLAGRYRKERLPIAGTPWWDGDNTFIDFAPGPQGKNAQLITLVTECDYAVLGTSLGAALERYASALASGELVWHADEKALAPKGGEPHDGHPSERFAELG